MPSAAAVAAILLFFAAAPAAVAGTEHYLDHVGGQRGGAGAAAAFPPRPSAAVPGGGSPRPGVGTPSVTTAPGRVATTPHDAPQHGGGATLGRPGSVNALRGGGLAPYRPDTVRRPAVAAAAASHGGLRGSATSVGGGGSATSAAVQDRPKFDGLQDGGGGAASAAFDQGREQGRSFRAWFSALGDKGREGAAFGDAQRRAAAPVSCVSREVEFSIACFEAQRRLSRRDAQWHDPEFRRGWES